jgi:hypothetical protein
VVAAVRLVVPGPSLQVAGQASPHELARLLDVLARMYANHTAVIERNNHGHTVIAYAKENGALNLYRVEEVDKVTDNLTQKIGWDTNERSKSRAIDTLSRDLEGGRLVPHSPETYEDLRVFVHGERGSVGPCRRTSTTPG